MQIKLIKPKLAKPGEQITIAKGGDGGFGNRLMTPLVEAVIELLESKEQ